MTNLEHRHQATQEIMQWFEHEHLPEGLVRDTSAQVHGLAHRMVDTLPDGPELVAGLRHLLEAKDCLTRQAIKASR